MICMNKFVLTIAPKYKKKVFFLHTFDYLFDFYLEQRFTLKNFEIFINFDQKINC